jgi:hypothetical protein
MAHPDVAALTSVHTELERITERLVAIADRHRDDPDDPLTGPLDELERTIVSSSRRLERLIRSL